MDNDSMQTVYHLLIELSVAEGKIFELVLKDKTNKEIAKELFRSIRTVENHRQNIRNKLGKEEVENLKQLLNNL